MNPYEVFQAELVDKPKKRRPKEMPVVAIAIGLVVLFTVATVAQSFVLSVAFLVACAAVVAYPILRDIYYWCMYWD